VIGGSSLSTSVGSNISNLGSISGVEKRAAANPAASSVTRASESAVRRPLAAPRGARLGAVRPAGAAFSGFFVMRGRRARLYDIPRIPGFL